MSINSNYFTFKDNLKFINKVEYFNYIGWSGLHVTKFLIPQTHSLTDLQLSELFPDLKDKEKIFVTTKGGIQFKSNKLNTMLDELGAIQLFSETKGFSFNALQDSCIFMISSKNLKSCNDESTFFNFKKDLDAIDLWGGQIISRPYEGKELTVVFFDLKPGFKFEDKGHTNEQITWLTEGEMDFYVENSKKKLYSGLGVDIASYETHGGVSNGAIGFDAF